MTAIEARMQVQKGFLWIVILGAAVVFGFYMATDSPFLILATGGLVWLATLPYHGRISAVMALTTYGSAFMLPMIAGRPFLWEIAALLGWSGMVMLLILRRHDVEFGANLARHRWIVLATIGYVLVLVYLMRTHGFGVRTFGGDRIGGRVYVQQIACAVFPLLFCALRFDERSLYRLYVLHLVLSVTFMVSDFALAGGAELWWVFYFLDLANDAISFEAGSSATGMRRFQSFTIVAVALFQWLLLAQPLRNFFNRRIMVLGPLLVAILAMGLPGGHRGVLIMFLGIGVICAWAQRVFSVTRVMLIATLVSLLLATVYVVGRDLPLAAQRTLAVLPGIELNPVAVEDARATYEGRITMREVGMQLVPNFLWRGRGFGLSNEAVPYYGLDPYGVITEHVNLGRFYNGPIGLMVNTGIPGTVCLLGFLFGVSRVAFRVLRHIRANGAEDGFSRLSCVVAALWLTQTFVFFFVHGDAEFAMNTFGLLAGTLISCDWALRRRVVAVEPIPQPRESLAPPVSPVAVLPYRA